MEPRIDEVASGVFSVEASHTNFILMSDGDEVTVVDTGYPRDRRLLEAAVAEIGRSVSDCTVLLLTHGHVDHSGSAEWLRREAELLVRCHPDEVHQTRGRITEQISPAALLTRVWRPDVMRFTMNAVTHGGLMRRSIETVTTFTDGEVLDVAGSPTVVHTPGHTSGHVGFHLADRGVLISGDALVTVGLWDPADTGPQLVPRPFSHDHDQAIATLDRYVDLDAEVLLPGHGRPWRGNPADAVEQAREHPNAA